MDPLSILVSPSISSIATSSSSSDPETAIDLIETIKPSNVGWSYRMDKISGKMERIDDRTARLSAELCYYGEETIPSMPTTPSLSMYRYQTTPMKRIFAPDGNVNRIFEQFPSVDEGYIKQLMKLYNNRENLVISALLSEGYTRPNFIIDESLFYKLKATFPNVENEVIRRVLIQNENKEHAAISTILGMYGLFNTVRYKYSRDYLKAKYVKLKYLKRKYPDIDEKILLDLLFKHDHNAQYVVDYLNKLGCKQSELKIKISKVSEVSLIKKAYTQLNTPRPKELSYIQKEHANFEEQELIKRKLQEKFDDIDTRLITIACEAADFEIDLATCFIERMTLPDDPKYITNSVQQRFFKSEVISISKWTQTSMHFQDLFGVPMIKTKIKDETDCNDDDIEDNDFSFIKALQKILNIKTEMKCQATWTKEDEELTRRPPEMICRPKCKAIGSSIAPEDRPKKSQQPISERTKAIGSQCRAIGSSIPKTERAMRLRTNVQKCNSIGTAGREIVRIKDQIQYNPEDDIIEVNNYVF